MENNITNFIETLNDVKAMKDNSRSIDSYELFRIVKDNEKLLQRMCEAVMTTYGNLEHIKKFIG